jgi:4-hydroxythreonine-4-phosphate dehydrogenase
MISNTISSTMIAPIAITMGDPLGIGPEIIAKLADDLIASPVPIVVIGDANIMRRAVSITGKHAAIHSIKHIMQAQRSGALTVLQSAPDLPADMVTGTIDARAGKAAYSYVEQACDLALSGDVAAIVTAPLNKEAMMASGVRYPGHTEILAMRSGATEVGMMLANEDLRVMLVSIHLSLADAINAVTLDAELRAIRLAHRACMTLGITEPRIAVAGLNPHAGENGMFGREEIDIIAPAIAHARKEGIDASGPWAGDTVFMRARQGEFDAVVAQYHDQGLIPVKYLGVEQGVNITVGLPFVRTSVDHGTAFDIAGTGRADPSSLAYALKTAISMTSTFGYTA